MLQDIIVGRPLHGEDTRLALKLPRPPAIQYPEAAVSFSTRPHWDWARAYITALSGLMYTPLQFHSWWVQIALDKYH